MQLPIVSDEIKVPTLSLWQPWAAALVVSHQKYPETAIKLWETRIWQLDPKWFGKRILIHAAKKNDKVNRDLLNHHPVFHTHRAQLKRALRYGAIIGSVIFDECISTQKWMETYAPTMEEENRWAQEEFFLGDYNDGRYAFGQRPGSHVWFPEHIPAVGKNLKVYNTPLSAIPSHYHSLFK